MTALFFLCSSTLLFEVLLTKLFANKLEHHYTFAVISVALLGFGASGVYTQLRAKRSAADQDANASVLAAYALAFAIAMPLVVAAFLACPLDPGFEGLRGLLALPVYFLMFALLFFLSGVPVTLMLVSRGLHPARVYFWDMLGAGLGAALGPIVLSSVGLYYGVVVSCSFAAAASIVLWRQGQKNANALTKLLCAGAFVASVAILLVTPRILQSRVHLDIVSFKAHMLKAEFLRTFGGAAQTYWNPIARIDVSHTAQSSDGSFRFGMPRSTWSEPLNGRLILVDGGANSRQFLLDRHPSEVPLLKSALWAFPYAIRPESKSTLLIGPGGGIDILVGKAFGVARIDALELNPDMVKLLSGRPEDPEQEQYSRWLKSDDKTQVQLINTEARQFARSSKGKLSYDIVLASGVDTLTAIQSSGNALTENFLYTTDAVRDYVELLRPGGILALTHWHLMDPKHDLKMLVTYLDVLDRMGVKDPSKRIIVVAEHSWQSAILKKDEDFTEEEVQRYIEHARKYGYERVYDPMLPSNAHAQRWFHPLFRRIIKATRQERSEILASLPTDYSPATDERPYFYWLRPQKASVLSFYDATWIYAGLIAPSSSLGLTFLLSLSLCALLLALPAVGLRKQKAGLLRAARSLPFFAATGFAFSLAENAIFLRLTLFVGGPLYSISLVLPAILGGYGLGGLLSAKISSTARGALILAGLFALAFASFTMVSAVGVPAFVGLALPTRVGLALLTVVPFGVVLGLAVPWQMTALKFSSEKVRSVAWMWATSSVGNVLGALLFAPICFALGVSGVLVFTGGLYVVALIWAAANSKFLMSSTSP
jgi:spermidine synthase